MRCASCGYSDDVQRAPADRRSWDPSGSGLCSGCCETVTDSGPVEPRREDVAGDDKGEHAGDDTTGAAR
jgi:hypothetical protein